MLHQARVSSSFVASGQQSCSYAFITEAISNEDGPPRIFGDFPTDRLGQGIIRVQRLFNHGSPVMEVGQTKSRPPAKPMPLRNGNSMEARGSLCYLRPASRQTKASPAVSDGKLSPWR